MNLVELTPGAFHLQSGSNAGLVVQDGKGVLIDAGLDRDTARRILRIVEELDVSLEAVFLTHAHADHFGGAHALQDRAAVPTYAPALEAALMEHPIVEPLYLFGGAAPIEELRSKFTLAQPCRVDHVVAGAGPLEIGPFRGEVVSLPGHALNQMGLAVGDVLFCADALFPAETLAKHKVTFCVDLDETIATLERLPTLPYAHFAPGHGPAYGGGEEIAQACAANAEQLVEVRRLVCDALSEEEGGPQDTAGLVKRVADRYGLRLRNATAYFLTRATVLAALSSLEQGGEVKALVRDNRLLWQRQEAER